MILTLTPNPSLDLLFRAERLVWDDANRVPLPRRRPGGQGINVVRAARQLAPGSPARAVALLGGPVGADLSATLRAEGASLRAVPISGETRVFVGVRERGTGRSLLLNPRGPDGGEGEAAALLAALEEALASIERSGRRAWVACCGSLLPGLPAELYARAGRIARGRGHRFVPDCDGEALRLAVGSGADLLVPNLHEAERLLGRPISGPAQAAAAARDLLELGPAIAAITLGADGAVAAGRDGAWHAAPALESALAEEAAEGSAVGAGDAFLAALLLRVDREPLDRALTYAVAAGTATLLGRGSDLVRAEDLERVAPAVRVRPA